MFPHVAFSPDSKKLNSHSQLLGLIALLVSAYIQGLEKSKSQLISEAAGWEAKP